MINNRQGGRRRGRGGQRQSGTGQPGNRQDNRQRGNAAQLLEKYKSMARDSQLSGDRVQTEYYLQFADHYFRLLNENKSRFEDQRRQRGDEMDDEEGEDVELEADSEASDEGDDSDDRSARQDRDERSARQDRDERSARPDRNARRERPRRNDGRQGAGERTNGAESIAFDALPPAIGGDGDDTPSMDDDDGAKEVRGPRRRTRAVRASDGEDDIAPLA